jgi:hypothetical protein
MLISLTGPSVFSWYAALPPIVGFAYDDSGSYDFALTGMVMLLAAAVILAALLREPRSPTGRVAEAEDGGAKPGTAES